VSYANPANQPDPAQAAEQTDTERRAALLRRGFLLEYTTLGWNVVGIVILGITAISARSVALAGFGLDSPRSDIPDVHELAGVVVCGEQECAEHGRVAGAG
jgi:hypothetical protein